MEQTVINWILSAFGALLGFLLNALWTAVKDLNKADKELADKVASIEIIVAGQYMKREEFTSTVAALFNALNRIEDKIDKKVDK